jgi:hypothetical protein
MSSDQFITVALAAFVIGSSITQMIIEWRKDR